MDETSSIAAIPTWEQAKAKRTAKRGKLTRLSRRIKEFCSGALHEQQMFTITKLRDDFTKEKINHAALQNRCEQMMGEREESTEEQTTREMELGDEADEGYTKTLHKAEQAQLILSYYIEAQGMQ